MNNRISVIHPFESEKKTSIKYTGNSGQCCVRHHPEQPIRNGLLILTDGKKSSYIELQDEKGKLHKVYIQRRIHAERSCALLDDEELYLPLEAKLWQLIAPIVIKKNVHFPVLPNQIISDVQNFDPKATGSEIAFRLTGKITGHSGISYCVFHHPEQPIRHRLPILEKCTFHNGLFILKKRKILFVQIPNDQGILVRIETIFHANQQRRLNVEESYLPLEAKLWQSIASPTTKTKKSSNNKKRSNDNDGLLKKNKKHKSVSITYPIVISSEDTEKKQELKQDPVDIQENVLPLLPLIIKENLNSLINKQDDSNKNNSMQIVIPSEDKEQKQQEITQYSEEIQENFLLTPPPPSTENMDLLFINPLTAILPQGNINENNPTLITVPVDNKNVLPLFVSNSVDTSDADEKKIIKFGENTFEFTRIYTGVKRKYCVFAHFEQPIGKGYPIFKKVRSKERYIFLYNKGVLIKPVRIQQTNHTRRTKHKEKYLPLPVSLWNLIAQDSPSLLSSVSFDQDISLSNINTLKRKTPAAIEEKENWLSMLESDPSLELSDPRSLELNLNFEDKSQSQQNFTISDEPYVLSSPKVISNSESASFIELPSEEIPQAQGLNFDFSSQDQSQEDTQEHKTPTSPPSFSREPDGVNQSIESHVNNLPKKTFNLRQNTSLLFKLASSSPNEKEPSSSQLFSPLF